MFYRRHSLVAPSWEGDRFVAVNRLTRQAVGLTPELSSILTYLGCWRGVDDIAGAFAITGHEASRLVAGLSGNGLIERSPSAVAPANTQAWAAWGPAAAAFHFGTRDTLFPNDPAAAEDEFRKRTKSVSPPAPTSRSGPTVPLTNSMATTIAGPLQGRRTWRRFADVDISSAQLSTLLSLTFGVTIVATGPDNAAVPLKTSPSGGARHPIEAYVVVNGVDGIAKGLYHYDSWRNHLTLVRDGVSKEDVRSWIPSQPWFWPAQVIVFMTAVFERTSWRYPAARAYRNILLEAGHLAQSFCLVATELKLAPFTTHALADSSIDDVLGIDGVREGVIYSVGCGTQHSAGWSSEIPGL